MILKVCGLNNAENMKEVIKLKPDFIGFIFHKGSSRYVSDILKPAAIRNVPAGVRRVGVFVNPTKEEVIAMLSRYNLDLVQLHGSESPEFCKSLRFYKPLIKSFGIDDHFDFAVTEDYSKYCEYFLFDTLSTKHGGTGKRFDWSLLDRYEGKTPFLLSGGIGPLHAKEVMEVSRRLKRFAGIDVNSRFETEPGIKDIEKLKRLIKGLNP